MAAITVADKAYTLGSGVVVLDSAAAIVTTATKLTNNDKLTISGLTKYDTLTLQTPITDTSGNVKLVGTDIQYYNGTDWLKIASMTTNTTAGTVVFDFTTTYVTNVTDAIVTKLLQTLTITTNTTTGTIVDARTINIALSGSEVLSDTSAFTIVGSTGADKIIYDAAALAFNPQGGDDEIIVEATTTVAGNAIDMSATSFEVLDATASNTALSVTVGASNTLIKTGAGVDTIKVANVAFLDAIINGGTGRDTLELTAAATVATGFGTVSNVEILKLADATNSITLAATDSIDEINGGTGADTIDASGRTINTALQGDFDLKISTGAGADVVTISQGKDNIDLGADANELKIKVGANLTAEDVITSGAGTTDKITLDAAIIAMTDIQFTGVTGFEELVAGTGATSLTLGDQVREAGIKKIDASTTTAATVDMIGMTADVVGMTVLGGAGGFTLKTRAEDIGATDVFTGGAATTDILEVATSGTITAAELAGVTLIEELKISATSGDVIVNIADANNFTTVNSTTSTGNNTINVSLEASAIAVNSGSGNDTITTGAGAATVNAGNGNNTITLGAAVNSVTAGTGNDTVNLVAGTDTLHLGAGENQAVVAYANFTLADTMDGAGTNTLKFSDAVANGTATVESKMAVGGTNNKIDIIKLGVDATQIVTLGANAKLSGVVQVDGSLIVTAANSLTVDLTAMDPTSGTFTVKGGAGNDIVKLDSASLTATTSLQMGGQVATTGFDTLQIEDVATIIDEDFTLSTGLEKLTFKIDGAHSITLGDKAKAAGITTIDTSVTASDGTTAQLIASTIDLSSAATDTNFTILTGKGDDVIKTKGAHLTSADTITAGDGIDTIELSGASNLLDAAFTNVTGIEKLKLGIGDNQSIVYAAQAREAGIGLIDGSLVGVGNSVDVNLALAGSGALDVKLSSGDDTIILSDGTTTVDGSYNIDLGNGTNTVKTHSGYLTFGDALKGGTGTDTLEITNAATLVDEVFTQISAFEKLVLANGVNTIALGAKAKAAGLTTVDGSASSGILTATVTDTNFNITAGSAADVIKIASANLSSLTFDGKGATDTIELTTAASLADVDFANKLAVETLKLNDFNAQSITLGSSSAVATSTMNAGLSTIDASGLVGANSVSVDLSGMTRDMTVTTAGGADTIILGRANDNISTGAGDDIIKVTSENFAATDTINGGTTVETLGDTLDITTSTTAITNAMFALTTNIETLKLSSTSGTYDITLGEAAWASGLREVFIADLVNATIDISAVTSGVIKINKAGTTGNVTVTTGAKDDNFIFGSGADTVKILSTNLTSADAYTLGGGTDTLQITDAATIIDADFTNISGLETIKVGNFANSITLGDLAQTAGVTTVNLNSVTTSGNAQTVDIKDMTNNQAITVIGGAGVDTIKMKAEHLTLADNITGGGSTDILEFTTIASNKLDTDFTGVTGVEKLLLATSASNQSLTLGTEAFDGGNGIKTIDATGTSGTTSLTLSNAGDVTILGGSGTTEVTMASTLLNNLDTITGGVGTTDKIALTTAATLTASNFTNITAMEILELQATTGAQSVVLGAGFTTVDAHTTDSAVTIDGATTTALNLAKIITGTGADTLKIEAGDLASTDSFAFGTGTDTLEITTDAGSTIADDDFTLISGLEIVKVGNFTGQTITIGNLAAAAGVTTIDFQALTGTNTSIVDLSTMTTDGITTKVLGGNGVDTIKIKTEHLTTADTITGGNGDDILQFTTLASGVVDSVFTNVTSIETLEFANVVGQQSITLGTEALEDGDINTIDADTLAGTNNISVTISDTTSNHALTIKTGTGDDTITMKAEDLTSADTINANTGTDKLSLTANGANTTIGLSAFTNVSGVEILELKEAGAFTQNITLGTGFTTVDASVATAGVTIDGATTTGLNLAKVTTGTGADTLKIEAGDLASTDSFAFGTGTDTLEITTDAGSTIADDDFTLISGLEKVKVGNFDAQSLAIGDLAANAGVTTIDLTNIVNGAYTSTVDMSGLTLYKDITVNGGSGNDTIKMRAEHLTSADTLSGNNGTGDTLQFTTKADAITDAAFTNITGIETLKLGNFVNQSVILGDEALTDGSAGGIRTIDATDLAGTNGVSITLTATADYGMTINSSVAGTGADSVTMKASHLTSADTIALGDGTADKLSLTANGANTTIGLSAFTNVSGVEILELKEAGAFTQNITLGTGFTTVDASVATAGVTIDGATTTGLNLAKVTTGTGADTLKIEAGDLASTDSFAFGTGTDTLEITTDAGSTIADNDFTLISGLEILKLDANVSAQAITLGDLAKASGLTGVDLSAITSSGNTTSVALQSMGNDANITITGGSGVDTISMKAEHLTTNDTLTGGSSDDILQFTSAATGVSAKIDADFTNVTSIEKIVLADGASQSLTLGDEALLGGGIRTIDTTALTLTNSVAINLSSTTSDYNMTINSSVAGTGADSVTMKAAHLTSTDTIALGDGTTDKIVLTTVATALNATEFAGVSGVEILELQATTGAQSVILGSGFTTVNASVATANVTIDGATTSSINLASITTGSGDDLVKIENSDFETADTIALGTGSDTIKFVNAATITNAQFANKSGIEILELSNFGTQTIELGDAAVTAGVTTVDFDLITNSTYGVSVDLATNMTSDSTMKILAGAGADTITMKATHLTSADTLTGGDGLDKITFTTATTLDDSAFTNVSGIETLQLANGNNSLTLGDNALTFIKTINGSALTLANALTLDMSSATSNTNTTILASSDGASTGADTITMKSEYLDMSDTISGGTGTDTLKFSDAATLTASDFTNVSGIENITLLATAGAQSLDLVSGLKNVDANVATAAVTIDASTNGIANLTITTGSGVDSIKLVASTLDGNDDIEGGDGTDTLEIVGAGVIGDSKDITDTKLAQVTHVEVLKLTNSNDTVTVTLGTNASANGINKVDASTTGSVNTINFSAMTTNMEVVGGTGSDIITAGIGDNIITAGGGDDTVTISASTLTANDTITGGVGTDSLILTGAASSTTSLANVSGFESIKLASGTGQVMILGAAEDLNNLLKVDASSVLTGETVTVDISGYEIVTDVDDFTYVGGAGNDTFKMQSTHLTKDDTLDGGAGTSDTLELTTIAVNSSSTDIFNKVTNFEILKLADVASDQLVTLKDGTFTTVDSSTNASTNALNVNAVNITGNITIKTAGGADTITAAKGVNTIDAGVGNDTIKFNINTYTSDDIINGGDGTDTLDFVDAKTIITDGMFVNKTNLEKIKLSLNEAGQSVTLSTNAAAAGINEVDTLSVAQAVTVDASGITNAKITTAGGSDIITGGNLVNVIASGAGNDTIKITANTLTLNDTINGEADTDTLELLGVTTLLDSVFTEVSNVEKLKLANETGQTLTLGTEALAAGFKTIDSSNLATTKTASINLVDFTQDTKIIGGAGEETITMKASTLTIADDIDLGAGADKVIFSDALSSSPAGLSKLKGVETIQLADGNNQILTLVDTINTTLTIDAVALVDVNKVTIDASALGTSTTSFSATTSTGADTITLGSSTNTVVAGGGDDTIKISMANLTDTKVDTINGGTGTNILDITTGGTLIDAKLAAITNISKVVLSKVDGNYAITIGATNAGTNDIIAIDGTALTTGTLTLDASTLGNETVTFKGGDANDIFMIAGAQLTSVDTIDGKSTTDTDTLLIKDGSNTDTTLLDSAFTNISNVEKITFGESANHSVTAGEEFRTAGFKTVDASLLATIKTFAFNASSMTTDANLEIIGGAGIDTITMNATHLTSTDLLKLGTGVNVLQLSGQDTIIDTDFNIASTGVATLKYSENLTQDLTVGTTAVTGGLTKIDATALASANATINASAVVSNLTILSGGGNDTITIGGANTTVNAGGGNDLIKIIKANFTKDDSIIGGSGDDILNITDSADGLTDIAFTNVSTIEKLQLSLTTAQALTLGDKFKAAGLKIIDGSTITAGLSVDISSMTTDGDFTITGGNGNDVVKTIGSQLTNNDKIDLGSGTDIIEFSSSSAATTQIDDNDFSNILGVETLKFTNFSNSVEFGDQMKAAGVKTIDGSTNTATGYGLTVDMTNMSTVNTTAIGGYTLNGGSGNDLFKLRADQISTTDTINGNGNGTTKGDTLEFTTSVIFSNVTNFTNVSNIETIKLANTSGQQIFLRDGLTNVLDASSLVSFGITVDGSVLTNNTTINTGTGDDIIKLGAGNDTLSLSDGLDSVTVANANFDSSDSINFGTGIDNLILSSAATLTDTAFSKISGLETITLSDVANTLTLGEYAKASGLNKIDNSATTASIGSFDLSSMSSNIAINFIGGAGVDTLTMVGDQFDSEDTISGNGGNDILVLTNTSYVTDDAFTNVTSIETLKLENGTHNVTLGAKAEAAGITTIDTSAVTNPLVIDISGTTGAITVTGRAGADIITIGQGVDIVAAGNGDDIIKTSSENLTTDTINGEGGTDSLILTTAINETTTAKFANVTGIENLVLGDFNAQEITLKATDPFVKIDGSTLTGTNSAKINGSSVITDLQITTKGGNDTIISGDVVGSKYIISSGNGDDLIQFTDSAVITSANDKIDGELGSDTLEFTSTSVASVIVNDTFGTHIKGIETIKFGDVTGNSLTIGQKILDSGVRTIDSTNLSTGSTTTITLTSANQDMTVNGGAGIDLVTAGDRNDTINLGAGNDKVTFDNTKLSSFDTVNGGDGTDIVSILNSATIVDDTFTNFSNIETLELLSTTSDKIITIGVQALESGLNTIDGSAIGTKKATIDGKDFSGNITITTAGGADEITIGSGNVIIDSGLGDDLIKVEGRNFDISDSIDGGDATDKDIVQFTDAVTLTNAMLGQISSVETIKFSDGSNQSAEIGDNAVTKNIKIFDATSITTGNKIAMDLSSMTSDLDMILKGGAGDDSFTFKEDYFTTTDTLIGGSGTDKIIFSDLVNSGAGFDTLFTNKTQVETIVLKDVGDHVLTIGQKAKDAGILSIDATNMTDSYSIAVNASAFTSNLSIASNAGDDVIIAGSGNDSYILGNGNDSITFKTEKLRNDIIQGGTGTDTIYISDLANISDSSLNYMTGFEKMVLSNTAGNTTITLAVYGEGSGLVELDGSAMVGTSTIDLSAMSINFTLKTGAGIDTIKAGGGILDIESGTGADKISMQASNLTSDDLINGGGDSDQLIMTTASTNVIGVGLVDDDFTNIASVESLVLANFDDQKVTIGSKAKAAGITYIDAGGLQGSNKIEIDATTLNTSTFSIKTGSGADTIKLGIASDTVNAGGGDDTILFRNADFTVADTVNGGDGTLDKIQISDAATVIDEDFTNVSNVEILKVGDFANQTIKLGANASRVNLKEVDATSSFNSVSIDIASITTTFSAKGGAVADTFKISSENLNKLSTNLTVNGGGVIKSTNTSGNEDPITTISTGDIIYNNDGNSANGLSETYYMALGDFSNKDLDAEDFSNTTNWKVVSYNDNVVIIDKANIVDNLLSNFKNIETFTLSDGSAQKLTLGNNATSAGLTKIDASALTVNNGVTIDISDLKTDVNVIGGAGSDTVTIKMENTTNKDSLNLGSGTNDTLVIKDIVNATTTGGTFDGWLGANGSGLAGIESLQLSNFGAQTLVLGANAKILGLNNIDLTIATSAVVVDATSLATGLTLNATSGNHIITTATGNYNDVITSGNSINIINLDGGNDTINAGDGDDTIQISSANLTADDIINGGNAKDTLLITDATTAMTDSQFTHISNTEILKLTSSATGQKVTIGNLAQVAKINTVDTSVITSGNSFELDATSFTGNLNFIAGASNDTFVGGQGIDTVTAADGNDVLKYSSNYFNSNDILRGGNGDDTLIITDKATLTDGMFQNVTSVETLKLGVNVKGQTIELGSRASSSGLTTLDLRGIDGTIDGTTNTVNTAGFNGSLNILVDKDGWSFTTSSRDDTITIDANRLNETFIYNGGLGNDTIKINTAATGTTGGFDNFIVDTDFTKMVSVETLALTLGGTATLADKAMLAGITTVDLSASVGGSTINATGFAKTLNVTLGSNTDTITTSQTAVMNDFISTTSANLDGTDTINLGEGNSDTIIITDAANLTSTNLTNLLTNIEVLKLGKVGNHNVNFSGSGSSISMIDGTLMTSTQTSTINITGKTETIEVKMGAGNDTIKMSLADLTKYSTTGTAPAQKYINGGAGIDAIIITDNNATITDSLFDAPDLTLLGTEKLTGIEAIGLAAGGTITLGKHASVEGITTIDVSASTGASTISTTAVTKDITVNLGANVDKVTTGGRADTVNIASGNLTTADIISLGAGVDTLNITTAINYANATNFGGIENVEVLKLSSDAAGQAVVLTGTTFTSLDARSMRAGDVTVDLTGTTTRIAVSLGEGSDTVKMLLADFSGVTQNINGGGGNDTIEITDSVTLDDSAFTLRKMSSFETIKLAGSLTVGSNFNSIGISNVVASAGLTFNSSALTKAFTVTSSTGNDIITLSDGNDTIKGLDGNDNINTGKGDDKFYLEGNKLDGSDTVTAGLGNDTIIFTSTIGTLADSAFTTVTGVETIQFENANGQIFTYGNNAKNSGVQTVGSITTNIDASALTAANGFTLDSSTLTVDALLNFIGGKGNDLIKTKSDYFLSTDKFDGGDGIDTIEITNAANITDLSFTNVKNIEKIKLNDFANALTLGSRFQSTGITTIGMTAASTLAHAINMSEVTSQKAYNIQGTAGIETISMQNDILKNGNVIIDAKGGVDILVITNASSLTDIAFTNITNLDTIQLSNFNNTIELGNKASTAGVRTVDGSSITTGNVTLDMTNMTADIGAILKGGAKIDTFKVKVDHLTSSDTINGGGDIDILTLSTTGGAITDVDFTNITSIETLSLTKAADYNITLNSGATTLAQTAGIVTVDGTSLLSDDYLILDATNYTVGLKVTSGAGNDTITTGTGNDSIVTGAGNDTISSGTGNDILDGGIGDDKFIFTTTSLTNGDKVQGGSGTDILNITDAVALNGLSTAFQYVSGIETLELDGGGSVVMNAAMITSGIREINGSGSTLALTIDGSAGTTGTKLILTGGAAADKIYAGHGTDTLEGGAAADIFVFSNIANSNGANVVKDFANGVDKIALSFTTGSKDFEDTTRVDAGTLSSSDFGNFVEDVSYATYDTDDNGTLDGNYALITLTGGDTISLLGVSAGIDNADFFYQLIN